MTLLLAVFWPGLAGAAALGGLVGWFAGWPARATVPLASVAAAALLAALAATALVPGPPGLWVESAALVLPPYLAGCALGASARRWSAAARARRRPPVPRP